MMMLVVEVEFEACVWSGDHSLLSSVPGRPRGDDGGEGWNLGGLKALLPRASGERWP
jgi:hypothetical protein